MSELPVITYTDSEGQAFNFMSDLDDVRDYQRVLVPRTTPEEPLSVDLTELSSEREGTVTTNRYDKTVYNDIYRYATKTIHGVLSYTSGGTEEFTLDYVENSSYTPEFAESSENTRTHTMSSRSPSLHLVRGSSSYSDGVLTCTFQGASVQTNVESYPASSIFYRENKHHFHIELSTGETYDSISVSDPVDLVGTIDDTGRLSIHSVNIVSDGKVIEIGFGVICQSDASVSDAFFRSVYDINNRTIVDNVATEFIQFTSLTGELDISTPSLLINEDSNEWVFPLEDGTYEIEYEGTTYPISIDNITEIRQQGGTYIHVYISYPVALSPTNYNIKYTAKTTISLHGIAEYTNSVELKILWRNDVGYSVDSLRLNMQYEYLDDTIYGSLFYCGRIISGSFHEFEWNKSSSEMRIGETVNGWTKSSKEYKATLLFSGTDEQKRLALNRFHTSIENDIMNETPGTLQWDDATIECYIRGSSTKPSDTFDGYTENEITIYCPRPFWEHQLTQAFYSGLYDTEIDTTNVKDWPHDYSGYDYMFINNRESYIINDGPMSEWQIIINGPAKKPKIQIGNNIIAMNTEIPVNSYLMIDSRDKIIYLVNPDGSMDNRFGERNLENYIFNKIEPGVNKVTWNGSYEWLLTLYEERSEPRWPY